MNKKKLSCESYYWLVRDTNETIERLSNQASLMFKVSFVSPIFYFFCCLIIVLDHLNISVIMYLLIGIVGISNILVLITSLVNLSVSKKKPEGVAKKNFIFLFLFLILFTLNFNLWAFMDVYSKCNETYQQYIALGIGVIGLIFVLFQFLKIKLRLNNGYYKKETMHSIEHINASKALIVLVISIIPLLLAKSKRGPSFFVELVGMDNYSVYFSYISTLIGALISIMICRFCYYFIWEHSYSKEEKEKLLREIAEDKKI